MSEFADWQVQDPPQKVAYRYEEFGYGWRDVRVSLREYDIVKFTAHGMWIRLFDFLPYGKGNRKWIALEARKKYACLTKEEALESYLHRKKRQVRVLETQLRIARWALSEGERLSGKYFCRSCEISFLSAEEAENCCKVSLKK